MPNSHGMTAINRSMPIRNVVLNGEVTILQYRRYIMANVEVSYGSPAFRACKALNDKPARWFPLAQLICWTILCHLCHSGHTLTT